MSEEGFPTGSSGALGSDGAYEIGGGDYKFGQEYNDDIVKQLFTLPAPTLGNALDLLRETLLKLPLEVLLMFKELLPDELEGLWDTVENAVNTILDALEMIPVFLKRLREFFLIPQLEEVFADHIGDLLSINWLDPSSIWTAVTSAWDFWKGIGNWAWAVLENMTGALIGDQTGFIKDIVALFDLDVFQAAWNTFAGSWDGINWLSIDALWTALSNFGNLIRDLVHWLIGVIKNLTTIDLEGLAESLGASGLASALSTWGATLAGINWASPGAGLMTAIGAFVTLAQDLGNWILGVIGDLLGWDTDVVHGMFESVESFVEKVIEFFWGESGLGGWLSAIEAVVGEAGAGIVAAIQSIYNGIKQFVAMFGDFTGISEFIMFLRDLFSTDGLLGWLAKVKDRLDNPFTFTYNEGNIVEQVVETIFGGIPVSQINNTAQNLLRQGNFNNDITIAPGGGWTWDGTTTATGTGGSALVDCTGSLQQLYSRQVLKVANGDRVTVSAKVKTSGFTAAGGRYMELAIVPWKLVSNVMTAQTPVVIATRTAASEGSWATLSGSTYTVSSDVIRLTVRLSVVGNSGADVWFDDVFAGKTGGLQQANVENMLTIFENAWNGVFGSGGAGKIWSDFVYTIQSIFGDAQDAYNNADDALDAAGAAQSVAEGTNTAAYNAWYGSGGSGIVGNMTSVVSSIKAATVDGWTVQVISSSGTWTRPTATNNILEFWAICIGGGSGGDKGYSSAFGSEGGYGGYGGKWMAKQITPSSIPSSLTCTVGAGTAGRTSAQGFAPDNGNPSAFGGLCSSSEAITASIASPVGFYAATDSRPGQGGKGGNEAGGTNPGFAGTSTPLAAGGSAGSAGAGAGGAGAAAVLTGTIRAGGGGGGGGGSGVGSGGAGGPGGWPGGGGGGGGAANPANAGNGGNGANGAIVLLYKLKT